jgi:DNA modification methylase
MNKVYFGDCRDSLRQMKEEGVKVQTCITSPPYYGLRDYGHDGQIGLEETPFEFIDNLVEVFACVWDILADDGTLWVNLGDSYSSHKDCKSTPQTFALGTAKEQAPVMDKGKSRIRDSRMLKSQGFKNKDLMGMPWRLAFALQDFGWYLRQDIIWHKPNPMPESVKDRCTKSHEYIFLLSKKPHYYFDNEAIKEKSLTKSEGIKFGGNKYGDDNDPKYATKSGNVSKEYEMSNKRDVWTVNTKSYKGAHFATYPEELVEPMVLSGSRVGDIVLDPFFGSGTTGAVAQKLGRKWIGCELNKDYEALQFERLKQQSLELI